MELSTVEANAFPGAFSVYDMEVLVPEIQKLKKGDIYLEVGVDRGRSLSVAEMTAADGVQLYGVDLQQDPKIPNTHFIRGDSLDIAEKWNKGKISLLFIDGDHSYEGCKLDIEVWLPHMKENGVILFHDCDETSPGVVYAVSEFFYKNIKKLKSWEMFKRTDKNTSMSKIQL